MPVQQSSTMKYMKENMSVTEYDNLGKILKNNLQNVNNEKVRLENEISELENARTITQNNQDRLNKFKLRGPLICYANVNSKKEDKVKVTKDKAIVQNPNGNLNKFTFRGPMIIYKE